MRTMFSVFLAGIGLLLAAESALAHHSFAAEFDANQPLKLTGVVTKIDWMNPHTWFSIDVTDEAGKVINWSWEMGSPNALMRAGWTRTSMKPGDTVTVEGFRAKDGSHHANTRTVTLASTGKRLFAASSQGQ